jgi:hypothetical protein
MTKGLKIALIVTVSSIGALLFTAAGFFIARGVISGSRNGGSCISANDNENRGRRNDDFVHNGMPFFQDIQNWQILPWMISPGMRGGFQDHRYNGPLADESNQSTPLTVDRAKIAVEDYLANLENDDLKVAEIILFSNNAYARIVELGTGTNAMELLVHENGRVTQEMGANMMWNLKYGHMRFGISSGQTLDTPMTVTSEQALADAQKWLDANIVGAKVADKADAFYGYYTIEYMLDGKIAGMVSVNGFSGDIFPHIWHGIFLEMKKY